MQQSIKQYNHQEQINSQVCFLYSWMKLSQVQAHLNKGKTWIYEEINAGRFPAPKKFGRSSRWSAKEIIQWEIDNGYREAEDMPC